MPKNKALFLDRDGVINVDKHHVYKIEDCEFVDGIFDLCKKAKEQGYLIIVVTNQAGIAKGIYTEEEYFRFRDYVHSEFKKQGCPIDAEYYCPYHEEAIIEKYKQDSFDRKPNPGMILKAQKDFDIDLAQSVLIGDKDSDIEAGKKAGIGNNKKQKRNCNMINLRKVKNFIFSKESNEFRNIYKVFGFKITFSKKIKNFCACAISSSAFHHDYYKNNYHLNGIVEELFNNQILSYLGKDYNPEKINLITNYISADGSNDNIYPQSTMDGAIRKPRFSKKIVRVFKENPSLLDIGCGAGGIVFDALEHGITAFGIDGSLENKKMQRGYWQVLDENLLTCDATKPYYFEKDGKHFRFKVISSWECLEHIPQKSVVNFLDNVYENLDDKGYFIGSISRLPYIDNKTGVVYHVTLKDENWWKNKFNEAKLSMVDIKFSPFEYIDFCRGLGMGWEDLHTNYVKNKKDGFLFVAEKQL